MTHNGTQILSKATTSPAQGSPGISILATILFVTGSILCKVLGAALATQTLLPATAIQSASPPMVNSAAGLTVANGV